MPGADEAPHLAAGWGMLAPQFQVEHVGVAAGPWRDSVRSRNAWREDPYPLAGLSKLYGATDRVVKGKKTSCRSAAMPMSYEMDSVVAPLSWDALVSPSRRSSMLTSPPGTGYHRWSAARRGDVTPGASS